MLARHSSAKRKYNTSLKKRENVAFLHLNWPYLNINRDCAGQFEISQNNIYFVKN
jgi:hypothetical protein